MTWRIDHEQLLPSVPTELGLCVHVTLRGIWNLSRLALIQGYSNCWDCTVPCSVSSGQCWAFNMTLSIKHATSHLVTSCLYWFFQREEIMIYFDCGWQLFGRLFGIFAYSAPAGTNLRRLTPALTPVMRLGKCAPFPQNQSFTELLFLVISRKTYLLEKALLTSNLPATVSNLSFWESLSKILSR